MSAPSRPQPSDSPESAEHFEPAPATLTARADEIRALSKDIQANAIEITTTPVEVFRRRGVKVSVFEHHNNDAVSHTVVVEKSYRDENGQWKSTKSLDRDDLPIAQLLLARVWEYILDKEATPA